MPDFPYLSYRNAYLLGEGFTVQDLRYTGEQMSVDNWCNVLLDENSLSGRSIPLLMPGQLTAGNGVGCFYCGVHSHTAEQCPTRACPPSRAQVWDDLAGMDLESINEGFRQTELALAEQGVAAYPALLAGAARRPQCWRPCWTLTAPASCATCPALAVPQSRPRYGRRKSGQGRQPGLGPFGRSGRSRAR